MNRSGWILATVATLLLAAFAAWWFTTFERVEESVTLPPRGEARYNPFFALKESLKSRGITVRSGATLLPERLGTGDVLLLGMDVRGLSSGKSQALIDFVENGGHLLFVVPEDSERLGTLPEHYGLVAGTPAYACTGWSADPDAGIRAGRWCSSHRFDLDRTPVDTRPAGERLEHRAQRILQGLAEDPDTGDAADHADAAAADADVSDAAIDDHEADTPAARELRLYLPHDVDGALALSFLQGEGSVTALVGIDPFTSHGLRYPGNAELVWQLLGPLIGDGSTVELIYGSDIRPWYVLLYYEGWPVWLPLLLALLAWLWWRAQRFGPLLPALPPPRRALLDHVRASGDFLYRQDQSQVLLEALRRRFRQALERRDPALAALSPRELIPTLAAREGIDTEALRDVLLPPMTPPARRQPREQLASRLILLWQLTRRLRETR
ncbi:MAG: DUF4350 domain-containing protein [Xanthomonadales bacterium]|jgi:hypothetical protein|nr:DUF4350 domain-containing protein [Xanthomonadales bacterium]